MPGHRTHRGLCHRKFDKRLVPHPEQTGLHPTGMAFRPSMDRSLCNDGHCRGSSLGQGFLSSLGQEGLIPFLVSVIVQRRLEHRFLRSQRTLLGTSGHRYFVGIDCNDHPLVQGRQQMGSFVVGAVPAVGLFCDCFEL